MKNENPKIKLNNITNRILPISESVKKGLEQGLLKNGST